MSKSLVWHLCVLCWVALASSDAQEVLGARDAETLSSFFKPARNTLSCTFLPRQPRLGFASRFLSGYLIYCRWPVLVNKPTVVFACARVTPQGRPATVLGEKWKVPHSGEDAPPAHPKKDRIALEISGEFAVGRGDYLVEAVVGDDQHHSSLKRWRIHAGSHGSEQNASIALDPLTVAPAMPEWDLGPTRAGGFRTTLLLHAAPVRQQYWRHKPGFHAWDRDFLLQCLYSVARQVPYSSLRVLAFNLDQQQIVSREDVFDARAFARLSDALNALQTSTISVEALRERNSPRMLVNLANTEIERSDPPDVVISLGPASRLDSGIHSGAVATPKSGKPVFFSLVYNPEIGFESSDVLEALTKSVGGRTFVFHSPSELVRGVQRLISMLNQPMAAK